MKKYLLNIFILLFALPAMAENVTISGTVYDATTGEKIPHASVQIDGTTKGQYTDLDGKFTITTDSSNITNDTKIKVSFLDYESQLLSPAENMTIYLKRSPTTLDDVTITVCRAESPTKSAIYDMATKKCYPTDCESERYALKNKRTVTTSDSATPYICTIEEQCETFCTANDDNCGTIEIGDACEDQVGKECTSADPNVKTAIYKWENSQLICETQTCADGYELASGKCVEISGDCDPMPQKAVSAHREWDSNSGTEICIIDSCKDGYSVSNDKKSCISPTLSKEDSEAKIAELQENANAMKEREQSTANKLLGAASIGAMGIGGMQVASALAEQKADNAAEQDMSAYIATFKCDYGQGMNIQGGESNITLPGANVLLPIYNEYTTLAADLKTRKEALGMTPGIESEVILDAATSGLYDNAATGITDGAFTSLSRALMDENSADAAEWAAQKADTSSQLKTGAIVAGAGALVGVVGNVLINEVGDKPKEISAEIIAKYEPLKKLRDNTAKLPDTELTAKCPSDSTGTYPNCSCTNNKYIHNANTNLCEACPGDKVAINNVCDCAPGTIPSANDTCVTPQPKITAKCDTTAGHVTVDETTGECTCIDGYSLSKDQLPKCECPTDTHEVNSDGKCVEKASETPTTVIDEEITLSTGNMFELNSYELTSEAKQILNTFATEVKKVMKDDTNYCISITGHTDKSGSDSINIQLSEKRANAVKEALESGGLQSSNITAKGVGSSQCESNKTYDKSCRKVEVKMSNSSCQS